MSEVAALPVIYRHLYLHVPFCTRRCSYCDFAIAVRKAVPWRQFARSIDAELQLRGASTSCGALKTLYLGGGTPSRLGADGIEALFERLWHHVGLVPGAEVTMEANPEDVTASAVAAWRRAGVNRVSLGVQSFNDRVLAWMHRAHDAADAVRAVDTLRAGGITSLSLDLIFAAPASLERDWDDDLARLLALSPNHIALYGLTIEPQTPLGKRQTRGEVVEAPEDSYEREFYSAHESMRAAGFEHYEVSNFAQPGQRARHNSAYWQHVPYLGVGPAAHGFDGAVRRWNHAALRTWEAELAVGRDPVEGSETLTDSNRDAEMVYLGLRTLDGLLLRTHEEAHVAAWRREGWIESVPGAADSRIRCSASGWLRLDALAANLTEFRSRW